MSEKTTPEILDESDLDKVKGAGKATKPMGSGPLSRPGGPQPVGPKPLESETEDE